MTSNQQTIERLKAQGFKVKISHRRPVTIPAVKSLCTRYQLGSLQLAPEFKPHGGETIVTIIDGNGVMVATGECRCHSDESFNRRLGLEVALGRAIKALNGATARTE